jgi:hypothetical protein
VVKNLVRANYQGNPDPNGNWWRFEIYCDECGKFIGGSWRSEKPNEAETDLCEVCSEYMVHYMEQELMRESEWNIN